IAISTAGLVLVSGCALPRARVARLGLLTSGSPLSMNERTAFRDGLRDAGWIDGQNVVIDERAYADQPERLPDLAAELVSLKPDVLVTGAAEPALALLRSSESIPIVLLAVTDPVGNALIASYARP